MFNLKNLSPMKKTIILVAACIVAVVAVGQEFLAEVKPASATPMAAAFNWTETLHDFGVIKKDVPVVHEFTFTNSGNGSLVISSVQASCGCTVTEYSKDPVPEGGKGFVKATYNAAKVGQFTKTVTIKANTGEDAVVLTIKGEVVE
jgi:purine-cytosine permease-like protein